MKVPFGLEVHNIKKKDIHQLEAFQKRFLTQLQGLSTLAIKDLNDTSWFSNIRRILNSYDLPSAYALLENPSSKDQWKKTVKSKITVRLKRLERRYKIKNITEVSKSTSSQNRSGPPSLHNNQEQYSRCTAC